MLSASVKMATLIDNYEQQYAVLTADITAKIGRIVSLSGGKRIYQFYRYTVTSKPLIISDNDFFLCLSHSQSWHLRIIRIVLLSYDENA